MLIFIISKAHFYYNTNVKTSLLRLNITVDLSVNFHMVTVLLVSNN